MAKVARIRAFCRVRTTNASARTCRLIQLAPSLSATRLWIAYFTCVTFFGGQLTVALAMDEFVRDIVGNWATDSQATAWIVGAPEQVLCISVIGDEDDLIHH